jgi:hypothetical protein
VVAHLVVDVRAQLWEQYRVIKGKAARAAAAGGTASSQPGQPGAGAAVHSAAASGAGPAGGHAAAAARQTAMAAGQTAAAAGQSAAAAGQSATAAGAPGQSAGAAGGLAPLCAPTSTGGPATGHGAPRGRRRGRGRGRGRQQQLAAQGDAAIVDDDAEMAAVHAAVGASVVSDFDGMAINLGTKGLTPFSKCLKFHAHCAVDMCRRRQVLRSGVCPHTRCGSSVGTTCACF